MKLGVAEGLKSYPVSKAAVRLKLFHSALGSQLWLPLAHANGGAFLPSGEIIHRFVKRVSKQVRDNRALVEGHVYTARTGVFWDVKHQAFTVHTSYGLEPLLNDVQALRGSIRKLARQAGALDANRRFTLLLLDLSSKDLADLKASVSLQKELIDVLTNSEQERIYVFLMSERARDIPELVHRTLDWSVFLGEDNSRIAQAIFRLPEEIYNEKRQFLGLLRKKGEESLIPLHDLIFNPSEWKLLRDEYAEVEEQAYEKFLQSLD